MRFKTIFKFPLLEHMVSCRETFVRGRALVKFIKFIVCDEEYELYLHLAVCWLYKGPYKTVYCALCSKSFTVNSSLSVSVRHTILCSLAS